jgi:hypothetical protein
MCEWWNWTERRPRDAREQEFMQVLTRYGVLFAMLLLLGACAARSPEALDADRIDAPAHVNVFNYTTQRMTLWVHSGQERVRLGTVHPGRGETYRIPSRMVVGATRLQFIADPADPQQRSLAVTREVVPGSTVRLSFR